MNRPTLSRRRHSLSSSYLFFILIAIILFSGIFVLILSGNDHFKECKPPIDITLYRGIGIGTGRAFSRMISKDYNSSFVDLEPLPESVSSITDQESGIPQTTATSFPKTSNLFWAWLEFISNDMILTQSYNNETLFASHERYRINRTQFIIDDNGYRQQINKATPYIDGSHIYGLDLNTSFSLRRFDGTGKLKTSTTPFQADSDAELLPFLLDQFINADSRATNHPLLTTLYTIMVREHNYWCDRLKSENHYLQENEIFHTARHIVIAELQVITYREVLPILLGVDKLDPDTCFTHIEFNKKYSVGPKNGRHYRHNASILNEFATAVIRLIRSFVTDTFDIRNPLTGEITNVINLKDNLNSGQFVWENGIDDLILGASLQLSEKRDVRVVDSLRFLGQFPNNSRDLVATDIARGRDHQLPSYQAFYEHIKKTSHVTCSHFVYDHDFCNLIESIYGDKNAPIDLLLGVLIEKRQDHGMLGLVASKIIQYQFSHIKHNDHYFYTWDRVINPYSVEIHHTKLSTIILRNTAIDRTLLDPNVFIV